MNVHSHYENLKVSRDAPPEVIRAAYKALSMLWHPDRTSDPRAADIMKTINIAYEMLSDPIKRHSHDEWLAAEEMKWTFAHPQVVRTAPQPAKPKPATPAAPAEAPKKRSRAFEIDEALFTAAVPFKLMRLPLPTRVAIGVCAFFGLAGVVGAAQIIFH